MIRKKLKLEIVNNPQRNTLFNGAKIQLPNEPLFKIEALSGIVGLTTQETIVNYNNASISELSRIGLNNKILVTSDNETYIEFDFPALGGWAGYGDGTDGDNQYLVYQNNDWIIPKYYSQFDGYIFNVTTTEYNDNSDVLPSELGINGLDLDNYYIDNDVYITATPELSGLSNYLDLTVTDLQTQQSVVSRMYYFNNNTLTFDLAIMIKALMRKPQANFNYSELTPYPINTNYGKYKIELVRYYTPENENVITAGSSIGIVKTFIRGGVIDQAHNVTAIENVPLRNCERLPVWQGYPTAEYRLINGEIIQINDLTNVIKEYRPQPDCNAYYFKFKNKKGGYSYWMFNKSKFDTSANNVGYSDVYGEITDFGSNVSRTHEVSGKIPYAFKGLAYDLLTSSETYLYEGNNKWTRVIQKSNKLTDNTNKRVFDVTFKFDKIINYNPTI